MESTRPEDGEPTGDRRGVQGTRAAQAGSPRAGGRGQATLGDFVTEASYSNPREAKRKEKEENKKAKREKRHLAKRGAHTLKSLEGCWPVKGPDGKPVFKKPLRAQSYKKGDMFPWHGCAEYRRIQTAPNSNDARLSFNENKLYENGAPVAGGDDHKPGCRCAGDTYPTREEIERWAASEEGLLCCGKGCPTELYFYIRWCIPVIPANPDEHGQQWGDKVNEMREAGDIGCWSTEELIKHRFGIPDEDNRDSPRDIDDDRERRDVVRRLYQEKTKAFLEQSMYEYSTIFKKGRWNAKPINLAQKPGEKYSSPVATIHAGMEAKLQDSTLGQCTQVNPNLDPQARWGGDIFAMPRDERAAHLNGMGNEGTGLWLPADLEHQTRCKGYESEEHALHANLDFIESIPGTYTNGTYDQGFYELHEGIAKPIQRDDEDSDTRKAAMFLGDEHPFQQREFKDTYTIGEGGKVYCKAGRRFFQKWQGKWFGRSLNKQTPNTRYDRSGMSGFAAGGKFDLNKDGSKRNLELFLARSTKSPQDCGSYLHTACWACWPSTCDRCEEMYQRGWPAWGPGICPKCPTLFGATWTTYGANTKYVWFVSGSSQDILGHESTAWAAVWTWNENGADRAQMERELGPRFWMEQLGDQSLWETARIREVVQEYTTDPRRKLKARRLADPKDIPTRPALQWALYAPEGVKHHFPELANRDTGSSSSITTSTSGSSSTGEDEYTGGREDDGGDDEEIRISTLMLSDTGFVPSSSLNTPVMEDEQPRLTDVSSTDSSEVEPEKEKTLVLSGCAYIIKDDTAISGDSHQSACKEDTFPDTEDWGELAPKIWDVDAGRSWDELSKELTADDLPKGPAAADNILQYMLQDTQGEMEKDLDSWENEDMDHNMEGEPKAKKAKEEDPGPSERQMGGGASMVGFRSKGKPALDIYRATMSMQPLSPMSPISDEELPERRPDTPRPMVESRVVRRLPSPETRNTDHGRSPRRRVEIYSPDRSPQRRVEFRTPQHSPRREDRRQDSRSRSRGGNRRDRPRPRPRREERHPHTFQPGWRNGKRPRGKRHYKEKNFPRADRSDRNCNWH